MGHEAKSSCCFNELKNDLFIVVVVRGINHKKAQKIPSNPKLLSELIFIPCNMFVFLKRSKADVLNVHLMLSAKGGL